MALTLGRFRDLWLWLLFSLSLCMGSFGRLTDWCLISVRKTIPSWSAWALFIILWAAYGVVFPLLYLNSLSSEVSCLSKNRRFSLFWDEPRARSILGCVYTSSELSFRFERFGLILRSSILRSCSARLLSDISLLLYSPLSIIFLTRSSLSYSLFTSAINFSFNSSSSFFLAVNN